MNYEVISMISFVASVATLILFIFYIAGRIITIAKEVKIGTELFRVYASDDTEHDLVIDFSGMITIETIGSMAYKYFEVSPIEEDGKGNVVIAKDKTKRIDLIPASTPFYAVLDFPGLMPQYYAEFQRIDGIKGSFYYALSGKCNELVTVDYKLRHTVGSVLFYLFR